MSLKARKASIYTVPFRYETPGFSIGVGAPRFKKKRVRERKSRTYMIRIGKAFKGPFILQNWYLLPTYSTILSNASEAGTIQKIKGLNDFMLSHRCRIPSEFSRLIYPNGPPPAFGITPAFLQRCMRLIKKNRRIRKSLTKFVRLWRRRKITRANEEDLITMDPPVKEVTVIDWPSKKSYHFESGTIERCMLKNLFHHDALFVNPMPPSNPYTNLPFTFGQLHSIIDQLLAYGPVHWAIAALKEYGYSIERFKLVHDMPLRYAALKATFADPTHPETYAILYDYIEAEHANHSLVFPSCMYKWALQGALDSHTMLTWRKYCYAFYEAEVLYELDLVKRVAHQAALHAKTWSLCIFPVDLKRRLILAGKIYEVQV